MSYSPLQRVVVLSAFFVLLLVEGVYARPQPQSLSKIGSAVDSGTALADGSPGFHIPGTCGYIGNQDVYGLGIRIGLYSQWTSTLISNWFHTFNLSRARDVNTFFQLAMGIAMLALATKSGSETPHAMDIYIIIIQIVGSSCTVSAHAASKKKWGETTWGGVVRFMIYFVVAGYSTYFWLHDVDDLRPLEPDCQAYGFLFVKFPLTTRWFRTLHQVISVLSLVVFTVLFGYTLWKHGQSFLDRSFIGTYRQHQAAKKPNLLDDAINPDATLPVVHKFTPLICVFILLVSIAALECLIYWNNIKGVNDALSTGQLIPLVTGVGGLIRVLYLMWSEPNLRLHVLHQDRNVPVGTVGRGVGWQPVAGPGMKGSTVEMRSRPPVGPSPGWN